MTALLDPGVEDLQYSALKFLLQHTDPLAQNSINQNRQTITLDLSFLPVLLAIKVAFLVGILFKDYAGFLLPDQIYTSVLPRKQHISSNTKSHSIDYNLLPQDPELCPECPELPYSTDTKFWSQNPYVENSHGNENSYSVQNFNYGLNSFLATDDLIEIPPDPFSHQTYSRRIDSLALDALDIGGRRNGIQIRPQQPFLKGTLMPAPSSQWKPLLKYN